MSTIQTQINLIHLQAGLSVPSVTQRTSLASQFTPLAITVGTSDEVVDLGDITTPKQVMVKLISGDPVRIGLDGTTYPFRLQDADEATLLRLDVEGLFETVRVGALEDMADSLDGTYFVVTCVTGETWAIGIGAITHSEDFEVTTGLLTGQTNIQVAAAIVAALNADSGFSSLFTTTLETGTRYFTIADKNVGTRTNAADTGSTSFSFENIQQGAASPVIHLKSLGTSEVVTAVAPH